MVNFTHSKKLLFVLCLFLTSTFSRAQFKFYRTDSIPVVHGTDTLDYAWAGGLNQPKFSTIDLNADGIKDLFVFDRPYSQVLTFINKGTPNQIDYVYDPQYEKYFPKLNYWALLRDYNCDGKEDIFAWAPGGFEVWKNVSDTSIKFVKISSQLRDLQCSSNLNIYATAVDIPSIEDVDDDGDLDILTYGVFALYVEYHKNFSVEMGYGCDSLKFQMKNECWGHFREDNDSCYIKLNDACTNCTGVGSPELTPYDPTVLDTLTFGEASGRADGPLRHSGSSLLAIDINGKNSKDLLIGDVSCNNLYMLRNSGASPNLDSDMNFVDVTFPSYNIPVNIFTFPAPFYLDVNNDGKRDLIVATNEASWANTHEGVWLYTNTSTDSTPVFSLTQQGFMQKEMIERGEVAYPVFLDYNNDGLKDLVVANEGFFDPDTSEVLSKLALYENTGTLTKAVFTLVNDNFANLPSVLDREALVPAFGDLDNDGDLDMLLGDMEGKIHRLTNTAGPGVVPVYVVTTLNLRDVTAIVIDAGQYSAPVLVDIDRDGDLDLIIGNRSGKLTYYQNVGTTTVPAFKFITSSFGGVNVSEPGMPVGHSVPSFYDHGGEWFLAVGSLKGTVYTYYDIDGNLGGTFDRTDSLFQDIKIGGRVAPAVAQLNGDAYPDMLAGNLRGGLALCYGLDTSETSIGIKESNLAADVIFQVYPNPSSGLVTIKANLPGTYAYSICDINGKTLGSGNFNGITQQISLHELENGMYFIRLSNQQVSTTHRVVKHTP